MRMRVKWVPVLLAILCVLGYLAYKKMQQPVNGMDWNSDPSGTVWSLLAIPPQTPVELGFWAILLIFVLALFKVAVKTAHQANRREEQEKSRNDTRSRGHWHDDE